jgi:hypothetical protein
MTIKEWSIAKKQFSYNIVREKKQQENGMI